MRPSKLIKLFYNKELSQYKAGIALHGDPDEIKIFASKDAFISVKPDGMSLSPGLGNSVSLQAMPQNMKYGGMVSDLPFPMSLMPSTMTTPMPKQIFSIPLADILGMLQTVSSITKLMARSND